MHSKFPMFILAGAPALLVAALAATTPAAAEGANAALMRCASNSKTQTINCCDKVLRTHQRPYWMAKGTSCSKVVSCAGGGSVSLSAAAGNASITGAVAAAVGAKASGAKGAKKAKPHCMVTIKPAEELIQDIKQETHRRVNG